MHKNPHSPTKIILINYTNAYSFYVYIHMHTWNKYTKPQSTSQHLHATTPIKSPRIKTTAEASLRSICLITWSAAALALPSELERTHFFVMLQRCKWHVHDQLGNLLTEQRIKCTSFRFQFCPFLLVLPLERKKMQVRSDFCKMERKSV